MKAIFEGDKQVSPDFYNDIECIEWALTKFGFIYSAPYLGELNTITLKEPYKIKHTN